MTTEIEMSSDFQTRIFEKIRQDIGSLMTDKDVKKLVEAAMEREFFTPVKRTEHYREVIDPPRIQTLVKELIEPTLRKAMDQWLKEHTDEVNKIIEETLKGGLIHSVSRVIDGMLSQAMITFQNNIQTTLLNNGLIKSY